ncbi:MAG: thioredoxin [Candidatus Doudnabacteria bacterium CG10_big_fil_rev_8_21_14_0_10_41_10]|uniref:Thioredoxin n=1 Tax=Candidatus Doudnabacteria bacterium CG10_big_fil_rev_8_21_14_0_10_41_10 TaxID=1974551 RepID=A0A2H0VDP8_9BACT|nr:MAG: thioredoxin [Candidatus Doudnabacteria bacterium CG10_big_fil_rev_8_21_14_0_10_41_10]
MQPKNISDAEFDQEVIKSNIPVFVDFWAEWCGPCKIVAPVLDELAKEYDGKIKFIKVNVDENPQNAGKFGVQSIPNMKIFKGGSIVDEIIGAAPKEQFKQILDKNL